MDNLKKGDIITVFGISSFMANTTHGEYKATGMITVDRKPIFTDNKKGARKKFTFKELGKDNLLFAGVTPFTSDGDSKPVVRDGSGFTSHMIRMNACLNLVGDKDVIKDYVQNKNLNKNFTSFDSVLLVDGDTEVPLFPDVPTNHAVVQRIRDGLSANK